MPTTIVFVSRAANAESVCGGVLAAMKNPDFIAVAIFIAIGLVMTIGLTIFLPLSNDVVTLLASTS
jgi:hypothetical protein